MGDKAISVKKISFLIIFVCFLMGCSKQESIPLPPAPDKNEQLEPVSTQLQVNIFLDPTLSMQGFVNPGTSTYYAQTLPILESAVISGWANASTKFYTFSDKNSEIKDRGYLKANLPDLYKIKDDKDKFVSTFIDKAITHSDENAEQNVNKNNLKIIVTDLFQNDSDVNLLTKKLKEHYIVKNLAVGILGVKSQFNGTVYDVGINRYSFGYIINNQNPASFRPFYVLILGKHADVMHYYERLKNGGLNGFNTEKNFVIFSPYLTAPLSSFEGAKIHNTSKLSPVGSLLKGDVKDNRIKQFQIKGGAEKASFNVTLKYNRLPETMEFNPNKVESKITIIESIKGNKIVGREDNNLEVKPVSLGNEGLTLAFELVAAKLIINKIYPYEIVLRPLSNAYSMPQWISEWDMDINRIEEWRQRPNNFNGAVTINLKHFLTEVWQATVEVHHPTIAKLYCYVKKE